MAMHRAPLSTLSAMLLPFLVSATVLAAVITPTTALAAPESAPVGNPRSLALNDQGIAALHRNEFPAAEKLFLQSLEVDAGNLTAAYNLSGVYIANNKKAAATELLRRYTTKYPNDAGLFVRLGDVELSNESLPAAIAAYGRAHALDPKYPRLAAKRGLTFAMNKQMTESEASYLQAAELDPKDSESLSNLSSVLLSNGKATKAIEFAKRSAQLSPASRTFVTLGTAYEVNKEFTAALRAFRRAEELGDRSDELQQKLAALTKATTKG